MKAPVTPPIARTPSGGFYLWGGFRSAYDGKVVPIERLTSSPRFVPSHVAHGSNTVNGERVSEWTEPDTVRHNKGSSGIKGGEAQWVRVLDSPEAVAELEAFDAAEAACFAQLAAIRRKRSNALATIWPALPSLKVADLRPSATPETTKGGG